MLQTSRIITYRRVVLARKVSSSGTPVVFFSAAESRSVPNWDRFDAYATLCTAAAAIFKVMTVMTVMTLAAAWPGWTRQS